MLFGRKKPEGKTLLLLDVENGSVGAALVRLEEGQAPRLFGETREFLRAPSTRDSASLLRTTGEAARNVLRNVAEVAARVRGHAKTAESGTVSGAKLFLSAPWGRPDLSGAPTFVEPMTHVLEEAIRGPFGSIPSSIHTAAGGVLGGMRRLLPLEDNYLLVTVGGEVSELLLVSNATAAGYATSPMGRHSVVRTLRTHGGVSEHEAQSLLRLGTLSHEVAEEAARHFAEELSHTAADLLPRAAVGRVFVLSHGNNGDWFARALSASPQISTLFPNGGVIRAVHGRHVSPALGGHGEPDVMLGLQALFVDDVMY